MKLFLTKHYKIIGFLIFLGVSFLIGSAFASIINSVNIVNYIGNNPPTVNHLIREDCTPEGYPYSDIFYFSTPAINCDTQICDDETHNWTYLRYNGSADSGSINRCWWVEGSGWYYAQIAEKLVYNENQVIGHYVGVGQCGSGDCESVEVETSAIIPISDNFISDSLAYVGNLFTSLSPVMIMLIGLPLAFFVVKGGIDIFTPKL